MIIFKMFLYAAAASAIFAILWLLFGKLIAKKLQPEDKPVPKTLEAMKIRRLELELRKAELRARRQVLEDTKAIVDIAQEESDVTEQIAQVEIKQKRVDERLDSLDRIRESKAHLS